MRSEVLKQLLADRAAKRPVVLVTDISSGAQELIHGDGGDRSELAIAARTALAGDRSQIVTSADGEKFLNVFNPPLNMLIVGAVHITQALAPMAAIAGYAVTVVDPRRAFASQDRFPEVGLVNDWPDEAMEANPPDSRTAVVTLTHDPKIDDPALVAALRSPAFYIGALGSRRTHGARLERLAAAGFDDEALARIHGPIGMDLGAKSPAEIAVSVIAQVTQVLRNPAPG